MPTYTEVSAFPAGRTPSVIVYISGLLCLCFDGAKNCTVGTVNDTTMHHKWSVQIFDAADCTKPLSLGYGGNTFDELSAMAVPGLKELHINVKIPTVKIPKPSVFGYTGMPTGTPSVNRFPFDKKVLDLESGNFSGIQLSKQDLSPKFYIDNGYFYACQVTKSGFNSQDGHSPPTIHQLGSIAAAVGADLFLDDGEEIELVALVGTNNETVQINGMPTLSWNHPHQYVISITNKDTEVSPPSDFDLYYQLAVKDVAKEDQFSLVPGTGDPGAANPVSPCQCIADLPLTSRREPDGGPSSDHVPCAPIVFGQSNSI